MNKLENFNAIKWDTFHVDCRGGFGMKTTKTNTFEPRSKDNRVRERLKHPQKLNMISCPSKECPVAPLFPYERML